MRTSPRGTQTPRRTFVARRSLPGFFLAVAIATGILGGAPGFALAEARPAGKPLLAAPSAEAAQAGPARCARGLEAFQRIELFFGLSRPGGVITEAEFKAFVDNNVTPRFPDGLTLLSGTGQFRDSSGTIVVEGSKLLILLVPRRDPQADQQVEMIRSEYKQLFQQQSVLRADAASCVSF